MEGPCLLPSSQGGNLHAAGRTPDNSTGLLSKRFIVLSLNTPLRLFPPEGRRLSWMCEEMCRQTQKIKLDQYRQ